MKGGGDVPDGGGGGGKDCITPSPTVKKTTLFTSYTENIITHHINFTYHLTSSHFSDTSSVDG